MTDDTVFTRIIRREIPADIVYEDDSCVAFRDINPQAPVHVLLVPREPVRGIQMVEAQHRDMLGQLLLAARKVAEQEGIGQSGYRLIVNCGPDGGQEVEHLHVHLLGGRGMGPMLAARP